MGTSNTSPNPNFMSSTPIASSSTSSAPAIASNSTTTILLPKIEPKTEIDDGNEIIPAPIRPKKQLLRLNTPDDFDYNREIVRKTRLLYNSVKRFFIFEFEANGVKLRADLRAAAFMKEKEFWINPDKKIVGSVPGICIGDVFFYRTELLVIGLHSQHRAEIDYLTSTESQIGYPIATSLIISGKHFGDVLTYTGHSRKYQKPKGGNLAMIKAMEYKVQIRVIRGFENDNSRVYVYEGLYEIISSWQTVENSCYYFHNFKLVRVDGQGELGTKNFSLAFRIRTNAMMVRPKGYISFDMAVGRERVPILVFNDVDSDTEPLNIEYLPKAVFPVFLYQGGSGGGCDCVDTCGSNCSCAIRNGGVFAYDGSGFLVRGKPLIYECGVNCKCTPCCRNRVTQRGLKRRLEVFRSKEFGWSVRTLELIEPGSFICEYSGVVLTKDQARVISMSGEDPVYPDRFAPNWSQWGDLSEIMPEFAPLSQLNLPPLEFAIDVSSMRNVAAYIGHSMKPNVMVQNVLYDHDNMSYPRIMLFALEAIAPMTELTIAYKCAE